MLDRFGHLDDETDVREHETSFFPRARIVVNEQDPRAKWTAAFEHARRRGFTLAVDGHLDGRRPSRGRQRNRPRRAHMLAPRGHELKQSIPITALERNVRVAGRANGARGNGGRAPSRAHLEDRQHPLTVGDHLAFGQGERALGIPDRVREGGDVIETEKDAPHGGTFSSRMRPAAQRSRAEAFDALNAQSPTAALGGKLRPFAWG